MHLNLSHLLLVSDSNTASLFSDFEKRRTYKHTGVQQVAVSKAIFPPTKQRGIIFQVLALCINQLRRVEVVAD
jgi:hypothetical protein